MKKEEIVKKYAFMMLIVGTALAFLVGTGIFFGILCLANSSIAGSIAGAGAKSFIGAKFDLKNGKFVLGQGKKNLFLV